MNAELITILILGILTVYQIVIFGHDFIVNRNQINY